MSNLPPDRRDRSRPSFERKKGIVSAAEIMANIAASGVQDDNDKTGVMGIRDNKALRANAASLNSKKKKK